MNTLTHFSLFSGIGGLDLAAEWVGFETVGQVEIDDYAIKVLEKHWPDVPRWRDIRDVTKKSVLEKTGCKPGSITLLSGGFPCQPFSIAGKRRGAKDDRHLWPEMLRVIAELRPAWVLGENVPGIVHLALDQCLSDLEGEVYETVTFNIPACAVDAPHRRARIFILAHSKHNGRPEQERKHQGAEEPSRCGADGMEPGNDVANAAGDENERRKRGCMGKAKAGKKGIHSPAIPGSENVSDSSRELPYRGRRSWDGRQKPPNGNWWDVEPDVGRVAYGTSSRVDRLKCLRNAVVPQQVYPLLAAIAAIEREVSP